MFLLSPPSHCRLQTRYFGSGGRIRTSISCVTGRRDAFTPRRNEPSLAARGGPGLGRRGAMKLGASAQSPAPVGNPWSRVRESNPLAPRYERGVRPAPRGELNFIWSRSRDSNPLLRSTKAPCDPSHPSGTPAVGLPSRSRRRRLERETGLEPVSRTRQVRALPLSYTRSTQTLSLRPGNRPPGEARAALRKIRPVCRLRTLGGLFTTRIRNEIHIVPRGSKPISSRAQNKKAFLGRSQEGFSQAAAM